MTRRMISIFSAILLLFYLSTGIQAADPSAEAPLLASAADAFTDVHSTDWFFEYVNPLYLGRIIGGFGDQTFRPQNTVTAGQSLKMILRATGVAEQPSDSAHWASGYLTYAVMRQWIAPSELSDLDAPISRQLVAKLSANALGVLPSSNASVFSDTADGFVQALYELSILGGYPDGSFHPNGSLSRAELSAIVCRILTYVGGGSTQTQPDAEPLAGDITVRTSAAAIDYIKQSEGFIETPYWDYSQYSIGYGSRCEVDEYPNGITKEQATVLLKQNIKSFETELDKFLTKNNIVLQTHQYDALICLTYNVGTSWISNSKLATLLKQNTFHSQTPEFVNTLASAIGIWCHVGSSDPQISSLLVYRRIREIKMFLYADYTGKQSSAKFHTVTFSTAKGKLDADIAFYLAGGSYTPFDYRATSTDGDVFQGWQTESGLQFNPVTHSSVTSDLKLTAIWGYQTQPITPEPIGDQPYFPEPYPNWH